jgi:hypothetical protein
MTNPNTKDRRRALLHPTKMLSDKFPANFNKTRTNASDYHKAIRINIPAAKALV